MLKGPVMHIRELASLTGLPERQIRYLIAEGFMPGPRGGRAHANYGDDHVEAVRRYTRLKALGFPPAAIKVLLSAREGVPFPVASGAMTLFVNPALLGSGSDPSPYVDQLRALLTALFKETPHASSR
jgi:DNA-binding transcriptional MerR regulator